MPPINAAKIMAVVATVRLPDGRVLTYKPGLYANGKEIIQLALTDIIGLEEGVDFVKSAYLYFINNKKDDEVLDIFDKPIEYYAAGTYTVTFRLLGIELLGNVADNLTDDAINSATEALYQLQASVEADTESESDMDMEGGKRRRHKRSMRKRSMRKRSMRKRSIKKSSIKKSSIKKSSIKKRSMRKRSIKNSKRSIKKNSMRKRSTP